MGFDPQEFYCPVGSFQNRYTIPIFFDEVTVVVDVL
jgi:hypothetical protein